MGNRGFIIEYVRSCTGGAMQVSDCGPLWQLATIAALLAIAIVTLVILRLRAASREE